MDLPLRFVKSEGDFRCKDLESTPKIYRHCERSEANPQSGALIGNSFVPPARILFFYF